ncbi:MAG: GTP-dependent dephospho-CoA kinase family protein [Candidatus Thorarchaeota archaeon]
MESFKIKSDIILPEEMRAELKQPLGKLLTINPNETLKNLIEKTKPPLVIFVGDFCVSEALKNGIIPDISIIDGLNLRKQTDEITIHNAKVINTKNPPAMITKNTWLMIKQIISSKLGTSKEKSEEPIVLFIDGEEDLLVFPAVLESPVKTIVVYGQPHEGVVVIKVTLIIKLKFKRLIERMKVRKNED